MCFRNKNLFSQTLIWIIPKEFFSDFSTTTPRGHPLSTPQIITLFYENNFIKTSTILDRNYRTGKEKNFKVGSLKRLKSYNVDALMMKNQHFSSEKQCNVGFFKEIIAPEDLFMWGEYMGTQSVLALHTVPCKKYIFFHSNPCFEQWQTIFHCVEGVQYVLLWMSSEFLRIEHTGNEFVTFTLNLKP